MKKDDATNECHPACPDLARANDLTEEIDLLREQTRLLLEKIKEKDEQYYALAKAVANLRDHFDGFHGLLGEDWIALCNAHDAVWDGK